MDRILRLIKHPIRRLHIFVPKRPSDICSGSVDTAVVGLMSGADVECN